jgi:hypothetical protein
MFDSIPMAQALGDFFFTKKTGQTEYPHDSLI